MATGIRSRQIPQEPEPQLALESTQRRGVQQSNSTESTSAPTEDHGQTQSSTSTSSTEPNGSTTVPLADEKLEVLYPTLPLCVLRSD